MRLRTAEAREMMKILINLDGDEDEACGLCNVVMKLAPLPSVGA